MTTLASTDDFVAITGKTLDPGATVRVGRLLELASDAVLASAHGQTIIQAETTDTLRASDGVFYFPQRPVTAVASVVVGGVTFTPDDLINGYRFTPGGAGRPAKLIRRYYGGDARWGQAAGYPWDQFPGRYPYVGRYPEAEAVVAYTHGWDPVPGQLVSAVVAMANGVFVGNVGGQETEQKALGSYSETLSEAQDPGFAVSEKLQKTIDRLCKVRGGPNVAVAT